jgi:prepilin signal peptidase PulO-like enzyme (type II secretory pathway)
VGAAEDRVIYQGAGQVATDPATGELHRTYVRPTIARQVVASTACAFGFALAAYFAGTVASGWAEVAAVAALVAVVASGYVISAIDHDTLTLDYVTLALGGTVGWGAAAAQAFIVEDVGRLASGAAAGAAWFTIFTTLNWCYRKFRGIDGIGGGDWKIAAVCAAVPAAVAGSFLVGFFAVVAGMFASLLIRIPQLALGRADRTTRFAMGPYIAVGWPLSWIYVNAQGLL